MKEYIALARARPAEITYGTSGPGTSHNMLGEALKLAAKVNITHAPYQGEAPAVIAAVGGHITGVLVNLFSTAPFIKAGKLRGLAVTTAERDVLLPDIPTAREVGYPDIEAVNWAGYVIHSGDAVECRRAPECRDRESPQPARSPREHACTGAQRGAQLTRTVRRAPEERRRALHEDRACRRTSGSISDRAAGCARITAEKT